MNNISIISIVLIFCANIAFAEDRMSKPVFEKIIRAAYSSSKPDSSDQRAYAKIIRDSFETPVKSAKLNYDDVARVLKTSVIRIGSEKYLIFKEKSKTGTLFIGSDKGDIIFFAENWAEEFEVIHPFYNNQNWFVITRVVYNDSGNTNENTKIFHVFERKTDGTFRNVISYVDSINYCIHNYLLPTDVKQEIVESGKFYTGCHAKAKITSFSPKQIGIDFEYVLKQDFLTDDQFNRVLEYFYFPKSGKKTQHWLFERSDTYSKYVIRKGDETDPLDASNLAVENF